jgi:uncharacterized protein (DUF1501 family)
MPLATARHTERSPNVYPVMHRRHFCTSALGGLFAFALRHRCDRLFAADAGRVRKRCLVLWMAGGPSQMETFDPKPGTATGGPTQAIATRVAGLHIAANLPEIAKRMDRLSIIRSMTSPEGDHGRGEYYLHTGYPQVQAFPRPALGSIVSHQSPPADYPLFVSIGARGLGPAYLGPDHAPFAVENPEEAVRLITGLRRQRHALQRLLAFNRSFDAQHGDAALARRSASLARIERMLTTHFVSALDIAQASDSDRQRYGEGEFAQRCLLARRLLEAGVPFVEVAHGGWDTHADNFENVARLCQEIDRPWSVLMDDLQASGLWEETVLVWMGEFGRTPRINANNGRDHFPQVTPVVLGGGGLRGGLAIGQTNETGLEIESAPVSVPDLFATLLTALGIDPALEFRNQFGAIAPATDHGTPIAELLA